MKRLIYYIPSTAIIFAIVFFLYEDIFLSVYVGIAVVFIFLIFELIQITKEIKSNRLKYSIYAGSLICFIVMVLPNISMQIGANWQHDILMDVGAVIDEGIIRGKTIDEAFNIYKAYHEENDPEGKNFISVFNSLYKINDEIPSLIDTLFDERSKEGKYNCILFLKSLSESKVTICARGSHLKGVDHDFINIDGDTGKVQSKVVITSKGVYYEPEN